MFYVGLDIHDKRIAICVLNETGQIVRRAFRWRAACGVGCSRRGKSPLGYL